MSNWWFKLKKQQKRNLLLLLAMLILQGLAHYGIKPDMLFYMWAVNTVSVAVFGVVVYTSDKNSVV